MIKTLFISSLLSVYLAFPALATPIISISEENGQTTLTLSISDAEHAKVFTLARPDRLVVDAPLVEMSSEERHAITLPESYDGEILKEVRYGQFSADTSRFVFDLQQPIRVVRVREEPGALVIDIESLNKKQKNYIRAKKDGKPLIVIDPGHGGVDPGTIARDGTQEKYVVLAYAEALRDRLEDSGRYDVILTRDDDRFIILRERFAMARKETADLFISLHADSASDDVRGLSVYTVSEKASDQEAEALAAHENKADVLAGMDLSNEQEDVANILISLAQRETNNRSALFADLLVANLTNRINMLERAHRFAGFAVLKAPDTPSVLIELGFLSHRDDERLLKSKKYRDKVTEGILSGVDAYFRTKKKLEKE
jgi:N-acetylmuramoyl-L-alanine amidase